jgi:nitrite reductase/ring-hydroxylating ferredoxin subunit/uncharacterized membrane protein
MRSRIQIKSHPVHPMLIVFPLGLWITSFVFEIIAMLTDNQLLGGAAFFGIIAGCVGAALAAVPGAIDLFSVVPRNSSGRTRGYLHATLNVCALALFILVAWHWGNPYDAPDGVTIGLSAIGVGIVLLSGWLGATLVYRNQIGVDHRYAGAGQFRERRLRGWDQPVCNQAELGEGQMMLVTVDNEHVVVGRCGTGFAAFSNHCTHRGGPLADGALVACTVQCPWHGSQFDIHTGRVVAGPAKNKIHTFDIEVRDGEVYLSPDKRQEKKAA